MDFIRHSFSGLPARHISHIYNINGRWKRYLDIDRQQFIYSTGALSVAEQQILMAGKDTSMSLKIYVAVCVGYTFGPCKL
jgi:hypothetical protein